MDSRLAKLCWIEYERRVKCSNMPKFKESMEIFNVESFSESIISAMSVDSMTHKLYFLKIDIDETKLYEHDFMNNDIKVIETFDKFRPKKLTNKWYSPLKIHFSYSNQLTACLT